MSVKGVLMLKAAEGVAVESLIAQRPIVQERWSEQGVAIHKAYPTRWDGDPNCAIALIQAPSEAVLSDFTQFVANSPMVGSCRQFRA